MAFKTVASTSKTILDITDAYTVILTNEAATIPANTDGSSPVLTDATTDIVVYRGSTILTPTSSTPGVGYFKINTLTLKPTTGFAITNDLDTVTVSTITNNALNNGTVTISLNVENKVTINKVFTWSKALKGTTGATGAQGIQGIQGPTGVNGQAYYTWVKYADTPTTGMSDLPDGKTYIGLAYNKTTATETTNYADYSWSLIKGDTGPQGPTGTNGTTYYTWIKYADTPTTGISDSPTGKTYMGIAYNKTTSTESSVYADYSWSLIKGDKGTTGDTGANAMFVKVSGEQVFKYLTGSTTPTATSIILTASIQNITSPTYKWQHWNGTSWVDISGATSSTYSVAYNGSEWGTNNSKRYRCLVSSNYSDEITIAKIYDGTNGKCNLLYNGDFSRGFEQWIAHSEFYIGVNYLCPNGVAATVLGSLGTTKTIRQTFGLDKAVTSYTLSCWMCTTSTGIEGTTNPFFQLYAQVRYVDGTCDYPGVTNNSYDKWEKVSLVLNKPAGKQFAAVDVYGFVRDTTKQVYFSQIQFEKGSIATEYTSNANEIYGGITTIDRDGIKIQMSNGSGSQGYSKIDYEGMSIYDSNNNRKAWFGDNDSAYIQDLSADKITNKHLIKWSEGRPFAYYIAPTATGDGTGRDSSNKSNSLNHTLNWIWNNYGCYSWKQDMTFWIDPGTYNEDIYIGGWIGTGTIKLYFNNSVIWYGNHRFEENTMPIYISGRTSNSQAWGNDGCKFIKRGSDDPLFWFRNSTAWVYDVRAIKEGWSGGSGVWTNYAYTFLLATCGSKVFCYNNDVVGFYTFVGANDSATIASRSNKGHCYRFANIKYGGVVRGDGAIPIFSIGADYDYGGQWIEVKPTSSTNSTNQPKDTYVPPPTPVYQWFESSFTASNLRTVPEGTGSGTSSHSGDWGQGAWSPYKPHRGYADLGNSPSTWCSGGRNFTAWLTMTRLTTSHGYAGEVPKPKIKNPDGSFWDSVTGFDRGQTKTIQLPSVIANAIASGSMKTLEMWAGTSANDYSFYNNTIIKIKCEKQI